MILTYRYRVKDRACATRRALRSQARAVNFVWNYCCQIDREAAARWKLGEAIRRPSAFELATLCRGVTKQLGLHSDTIDAICGRFTDARHACFPKTPRFRSFKRNLDWIPVSNFARPAKLEGSVLTFLQRRYHLWLSRPIPDGGKAKSWNFGCDSRGRWYVNIAIEIPEAATAKAGTAVGIDLGLKTLATLSDGRKIEMPAFYRQAEAELAKWQRFGKRKRVTALAAKVANQRKHFLHVVSTGLVREYGRIVVGDVSAARLAKTRMAKSVLDAGWSMLRSQLRYKALMHGVGFEIVSERYSSVSCSSCGARSGPQGQKGLRVREWICEECGVIHDRDVNASLNLLLGAERRPPVVGILCA